MSVEEARANLQRVYLKTNVEVDDAKRALNVALYEMQRAGHPEWAPLMAQHVLAPEYDRRVELAASLEAVRREVCAYRSFGNRTCDCKYGRGIEVTDGKKLSASSEMTGCPELRDAISLLLGPS